MTSTTAVTSTVVIQPKPDLPNLLAMFVAAGMAITPADDITDSVDICPWCQERPAQIRVTGDPSPMVLHPVECTEACTECAPWVVTRALNEQASESAYPIKVEVQTT
jgi:hypothetical protein